METPADWHLEQDLVWDDQDLLHDTEAEQRAVRHAEILKAQAEEFVDDDLIEALGGFVDA